MGAFDRVVAAALPFVPRALVGRFARPYIAGETLEAAVETVRRLGAEGAMATLDVLGEEAREPEEAEEVVGSYAAALDRIAAEGLESNVSVKLTALGHRREPARAEARLRTLVQRAADHGNFVRVDMEDSSMTSPTLEIYRRLRRDHDNLGVVLQANLRRTREDLEALVPLRPSVRVVKGIYVEPEAVSLAGRRVVQDSFVAIVQRLLEADCPTAIATHDRELVERSLEVVEGLGLGPDRYELQMLLGVRPALRRELLEAGHRLRVYVPYGTSWYEYSVRRLRENPAMAGHVTRNLFAAKR